MVMDDADVIAAIREAIAREDYAIHLQHSDAHRAEEGFSVEEMEHIVLHGAMIESRPLDNRWLFCGRVRSLKPKATYRGQWLHVSVQRDDDAKVAIVTAYRPLVSRWVTERKRRKGG